MNGTLEFEKQVVELESKIAELQHMADNGTGDIDIAAEITRMQNKTERLLKETYSDLSAAQKVQVARHASRPHTLDYVNALITDFTPLAGDRNFGEDLAMISGIGRLNGMTCVILGQEKGSDTTSRIKRNFGMPRPEGYRKAIRLMEMANRFKIPVISFVDTAGAYPGVGAEERGQSEAIARSVETCLNLNVPMITVIIGEGGSGGAIAIAAADEIIMLEHSIYSVISPEGCASILWRSAEFAKDAATALKLTAQDLQKHGLIDTIIPEPLGGAHRNPLDTIKSVGDALRSKLEEKSKEEWGTLKAKRREKFLAMGRVA